MKNIIIQLVLILTTLVSLHAQRGRVQIQNGTLVTDKGTLLRGAFVFIDVSYGRMPTKENVSAIKNLGLNCVHLYAENPCCQFPGENVSLVDSLVKWTANDSLYLVLTMAGWTPERDSFVYAFWSFYAERYKDETHVIYEICNEPESCGVPYTPSITPMEINTYDTIRAHAPETHVLMLSSVYSIEMDSIFKRLNDIGKHVNWNNTSVAMHGYCRGASEDVKAFNKQMQDSGYTITITEFLSVLKHQYAGRSYIRVFEEQQISYLNFLEVTKIVDYPEYFKTMIEKSEIRWTPDFGTWPASLSEIKYYDPFTFRWGAMNDDGKGWYNGPYPSDDLEYIDNDDYVAYYNLNFEDTPIFFEVMCSSDNGNGNIEIHLDSLNGPVVGICTISNTGGWNTYKYFTCDITTPFEGIHKIYLVFKGTGEEYLFNIKFWYFGKSELLAPQTPYHVVASVLPGKIEAEEYDYGGSTVSFLDMDSDTNGIPFRNDDVDIDTTGDGSYCIAWTGENEWLEYTVSNEQETAMDIQLRGACVVAGDKIRIKLNNQVLTIVDLPNTGGFQNWETVTIEDIRIPAGEDQILRIELLGGYFNLDWMNFVASETNSIDKVSKHKPITFYPNPANDHIIINTNEKGVVEIYNLHGKLLIQKQLSANDNIIPVKNLSSGSYVLKITNDSKVHSEILIID